jgi:hypothetical protein
MQPQIMGLRLGLLLLLNALAAIQRVHGRVSARQTHSGNIVAANSKSVSFAAALP